MLRFMLYITICANYSMKAELTMRHKYFMFKRIVSIFLVVVISFSPISNVSASFSTVSEYEYTGYYYHEDEKIYDNDDASYSCIGYDNGECKYDNGHSKDDDDEYDIDCA